MGAALAAAPVARAGYTAVQQPARHGELGHEQILEHVYGGDFVADPTGLSFSNQSGVTVTRLDDAAGADDVLAGKRVTARAVAAFSGRRKTSGYFGASDGSGQVRKLFNVAGRHFDLTGASQGATPVTGELVFAQGRGRTAKTFSTVASANRDGVDHAVTYEVKGLSGQPASVYLVCWENRFASRSDRDYNDLVVEVQAAEAAARAPLSQPLLIPAPGGVWSGLAGLLGVGVVLSRARRSRYRVIG